MTVYSNYPRTSCWQKLSSSFWLGREVKVLLAKTRRFEFNYSASRSNLNSCGVTLPLLRIRYIICPQVLKAVGFLVNPCPPVRVALEQVIRWIEDWVLLFWIENWGFFC